MLRTIPFVLGAAVMATTPAAAAVQLCSGSNCAATSENVLVTAQTTTVPGTPVVGTTNSTGVAVAFTSGNDVLIGSSNGQADISSADGLLNSLSFALASGFAFSSAVFNLFPVPGQAASEATSVVISYATLGGGGMQTRTIDTNGQNFIGIFGDAGELFTSISFSGAPISTGIQDVRQVRLAGVQAVTPVPEPTTWVMLILGFGLIGAGMRRGAERPQQPVRA